MRTELVGGGRQPPAADVGPAPAAAGGARADPGAPGDARRGSGAITTSDTEFSGRASGEIPQDLETLAYRVVQEALSNAGQARAAPRHGDRSGGDDAAAAPRRDHRRRRGLRRRARPASTCRGAGGPRVDARTGGARERDVHGALDARAGGRPSSRRCRWARSRRRGSSPATTRRRNRRTHRPSANGGRPRVSSIDQRGASGSAAGGDGLGDGEGDGLGRRARAGRRARLGRRAGLGSGDGLGSGEGDGVIDGAGGGGGVGAPNVWPSNDGVAKSLTCMFAVACVMKSCQIAAGIVPPKTAREALDVVQRDLALRVAHPHAGRELRHVAAEPGVDVVLRGPGLAGGRAADVRGGAGPARDHDACERVRDEVGVVLPQDLLAPAADLQVGLAVREVDPLERRAHGAATRERRASRTRSSSRAAFTACVPSVIEHTGSSGDRMPMRCAMSTIARAVTADATCAKTVFTENAVACSSVKSPLSSSAAFESCQGAPSV